MQRIVLIGASTGGPGHLQKIVASLPADTTATFVLVQHMHKKMLKSFVSQLAEIAKVRLSLVEEREALEPGVVYVCAENTLFEQKAECLYLVKTREPSLYVPSINLLFDSAQILCSSYSVCAILLTGIGDDGAAAICRLEHCGAQCIAESEESAVVYGMPKQALSRVPHIKVLHLQEIIRYLAYV